MARPFQYCSHVAGQSANNCPLASLQCISPFHLKCVAEVEIRVATEGIHQASLSHLTHTYWNYIPIFFWCGANQAGRTAFMRDRGLGPCHIHTLFYCCFGDAVKWRVWVWWVLCDGDSLIERAMYWVWVGRREVVWVPRWPSLQAYNHCMPSTPQHTITPKELYSAHPEWELPARVSKQPFRTSEGVGPLCKTSVENLNQSNVKMCLLELLCMVRN